MTVEKNDVDINKLFTWSKESAIEDGHGTMLAKIWLKLIGDADLNRARVFALRKSAELRIKLKDPTSDEHMAFVQDVSTTDKQKIIDIIISLNLRPITRDAYSEVKLPIPKEPDSDAELEKQEKYQKELDEYPAKRDAAVRKYMSKRITKLTEELYSLPDEELQKQYEYLLINELCEQESFKRFKEMSVFFSVYKDKNFKNRMFSTFEDFDNITPSVKERLMTEYTSLELDTEALKK